MANFLIHWRLWHLAKIFNSCPAINLGDFIVHMEGPMAYVLLNLLVPSDLLHSSSTGLQSFICIVRSITAPPLKSLTQIHPSLTSSPPESCSHFSLQSFGLSACPHPHTLSIFSHLLNLDYIIHHFANTLQMTLRALALCHFIAFIWQNSNP